MEINNYDFSGWATRNDLKCADGRVIRKDAFKGDDGMKVPLVYNHDHNSTDNILGHALLENREEGVYVYGFFNGTESGKDAKEQVRHGDVTSLSIFANHLKEIGKDVVHGVIREVSLVLAGANPGAFIDFVMMHGDSETDGLIVGYDEAIELMHSEPIVEEAELNKSNSLEHSDSQKEPDVKEGSEPDGNKETEPTIQEIIDTMNEDQKNAMYALVGMAVEDTDNKEDGGENMKHNLFENDQTKNEGTLTHSDGMEIISLAKTNNVGSLQTAISVFASNHESELAHGINSVEQLFPDYADVRPGAPEMLTTDQGWVGKVLNKIHKSPISRIRTRQADVRNIENIRARGYKKGDLKNYVGNIDLIHRTTDPQTVYVKSKLDRDDIVDIVDFDTVQYMYNIDRMNLNEELATAIMIGDGRNVGVEGKIAEDKIRPVWLDDELYTIHVDVDVEAMRTTLQGTSTNANFGDNYIYAEAIIQSLLYAREKYKGTGTPDFYCTPHLVNVMLLARDLNGRRIYDKVSDLAAALNVNEIITAEQFEGKTRTTTDNKTKKILGIMCNLADYSLGATKGGEITHFTDFDIDFNQEKSLLETRCSGASTRVMSAIALEEDVTQPVG